MTSPGSSRCSERAGESRALGCSRVAADEKSHRLAARDALLFLLGRRDAVPAQLLVELRARDPALRAVHDVGKQLLVAAPHLVELAFDLIRVHARGRLRGLSKTNHPER